MTKKQRQRERADTLMVRASVAKDLEHARALIMAGRVLATSESGHEQRVEKAGTSIDANARFRITGKIRTFVSRGGDKLAHALDTFAVDPAGLICADIGISTGGFTDCLLERGALRVHGVDVGYGQLDWRIRNDPRVVLHERTNARTLPENAFDERVQLIVIDVSFISLDRVLAPVAMQLVDGGRIVALVKPQFEAARDEIDGGIVRDPNVRERAIARIVAFAGELRLTFDARSESPILGADGNVEHFVLLSRRPHGP